jgi:integrase
MGTSDTAIKKARPREKQYKIYDEKGLYCLVTPAGGKLWRLKYRFGGMEKTLSIGKYPDISLKIARTYRDEARSLLAQSIDPSAAKQAEKVAEAGKDSFEAIAREWHGRQLNAWAESTAKDAIQRLEKNIFPFIGGRGANDITPPELLAVLRRMESRGAHETAKRVRALCGQVFRYAISTGRCERDPAADLQGALTKVVPSHFAAVTDPAGVGQLLRAIDGFEGTLTVQIALKLSPLLAVRPGELRHAQWSEFDLDKALWSIPAEKMKKRRDHLIPLSAQALILLEEIRPLTDRSNGSFVFPSIRTRSRPMSENTINAALRRLGYSKEQMTAHGFRSMFSTILNEQGWSPDWIEMQLAHSPKDAVRSAYNRAAYMDERTKMMQHWADYLDGLRADNENRVVSINRA